MENKCICCFKPLKVIGHLRKNGKNHKDWDSRNLHKKCWNELRKKRQMDLFFNHLLEKELNK